ncbi:protein FAR1-RELATED SEQUENCE 3-like [Triticum dicoccoides]|nr:protein FAR1-RELATED SEQUENCE 3-like [Triticum dicoccoides]XP_037408279.1 protein FAR1-RELATED SEQUENCE 3-like [Triticum dicoccoides]
MHRQVYTRTMFEKFGEALYECGSYDLIEVEPRLEYIARHIKFQSGEKWCKNEFVISVSEPADEFISECGTFEHYGMVCSHVLKVMIHLKLYELPPKHVLKRWTRDARDILPPEYLRYQKDHGPLKYSSRRHNTLYLLALDVVKLGNNNVEAHALAMEKMRDVKVLLEPVAAVRDRLGLSDRELAADSGGSGVGNKQHFGRAESEHTISQGLDLFPASCKKRPAGRPTTSRDKAPYEQPSKRSRLCSICRIQGH